MIRILCAGLDRLLELGLMMVILLCGYMVYDSATVMHSAVLGAEIKQYAPADEDEKLRFENLANMNANIIGWIRIDGTSINYPLLQAENNEYYLARNYLDEFATAGSIFLDYRNDFEMDDFLIIYGHRMSYGKMFSDIVKYADAQYWAEHQTGKIYSKTGRHELKVVAYAQVAANAQEIYGRIDLVTALGLLHEEAKYWRESSAQRFVLLSTCDARNKNRRNVLLLEMF